MVAVVALICFTQGTFWTVLLAAAIVGLGTLEFTAGLQARGFRPASSLALVGAVLLPIAARQFGTAAYPVFFGLMVVFSLLWFLWEITPGRPLLGVATTVLAFAYVGGLGGFAGLLLASPDGVGLILGVALCVITYDVVGFFVGSQFGKSPIAPRVSPNKSFEGTLAGMVGAVLMGWILVGGVIFGGIEPWSPGKGAVLGLFVAAGAFLGDLCESMLKRDLGVKDFGSLLPGHGGVLDRFDALLFCLPITYYLAVQLNILQALLSRAGSLKPFSGAGVGRRPRNLVAHDRRRRDPRIDRIDRDPGARRPRPPPRRLPGRRPRRGPQHRAARRSSASRSASHPSSRAPCPTIPSTLAELAALPEADVVLNAVVGFAGPARDARRARSRQAPRAREQGEPHRGGPGRRQGARRRRRRDRARRLGALGRVASAARRAHERGRSASCSPRAADRSAVAPRPSSATSRRPTRSRTRRGTWAPRSRSTRRR